MSMTFERCCELANDGVPGVLVDFYGYEVPYNIHRLTKKVLRRLKRDGIVVVNYDDSFGRVAAEELEDIAGAIGLTFAHVRNHQFIIADEDGGLVKAMSLDSIDSDFPE
jgi:spermidine synthase